MRSLMLPWLHLFASVAAGRPGEFGWVKVAASGEQVDAGVVRLSYPPGTMEAADYFETSPSLEGGSGYGHSELETSNFFGAPTTHQQQPALAADELWQAHESPCKQDCLLRGMAGYVSPTKCDDKAFCRLRHLFAPSSPMRGAEWPRAWRCYRL